MTPYWSHFLTLYRSKALAQYRGYFLTFLKVIFWPCTEVIIWPWINRGHILTLLRNNFVTLNIFTALRSFSHRSTLKEAFFWCFMYQRPFCDPVQRSFSDLFYEGFLDDFHWLLIPLTTFCVVLGHVAVIWSREPPPSLIYNDRSRSFLLYIWYTQRSTTQPINIQGKFNPLNNTKYRIIIYLLLCHWLIQRGVKLFLDAARVDLMQYMYCFWLIIYIDMWPKWTYICQHTKRNLNWESLII